MGSDVFPNRMTSGLLHITKGLDLHSKVCRCEVVLFADWLSGWLAPALWASHIRAEEGWRRVVRGVSHCGLLAER